jgi:hypothetical protein
MSRFFETIEVQEDSPQFLIVGESAISEMLVKNLLSSEAQVFYLSSSTSFPPQQNFYKISDDQISNISDQIRFVFFEKEPSASLEEKIHKHCIQAKFIFLNPKSLKNDAVMIFSPFIYGPGVVDSSFGFLALNIDAMIKMRKIVLPENLTEEIRPTFYLDVVEEVEKAMFTLSLITDQNIIFLQGPDKISFAAFLGGLKGKLKSVMKTEYLGKKLAYRMPNAGRIEIGRILLEKGMNETAKFLEKNVSEIQELKNITSFDEKPVRKENRIEEIPKNIPIVSMKQDDDSGFSLNDEFVKNIYRDNLEFLEKSQLVKRKNNNVTKQKSVINQKIINLTLLINKIRFFSFLNFRKKIIFKRRKFVSRRGIKIVFGFVALLISPLLVYFFFFLFSLFSLRQNLYSLKQFDLKKSYFWRQASLNSLVVTRTLHFKIIKYYYLVLGKQKSFQNDTDLLSLENELLSFSYNVENILNNVNTTVPYILGKSDKKPIDVEKAFQNSFLFAEEAKNDLSSTIALLKNQIPSLPFFLRFKNDEYYQFLKSIPMYSRDLGNVNELLREMPEIIGDSSKKTYAILFQNNMELRSTGGFIGSFALLTFEKKKLIDFEVYDVYDADGQLKGHIQPPPEILHYLKQPDFFLRDANVSPNFPETAEKVSWFLAKEMRAEIDGVFAVDISTVSDILRIYGPIYLPDYKETVTAQNLFEKAERASEVNYFSGSTNKKDFLSLLAKALWLKLFDSSKENIMKIVALAKNSIDKRNLQIYLTNPRAQKVINLIGADGEMRTVGDQYLNIIENNYGANKANYFVKRSIDHRIDITKDGFVNHVLNISYLNFSPLSMWPTGDYSAYIKIYVDKNSVFKDLQYEGKKVKLSEFLNEFVLEELKPKEEQLVLQGIDGEHQYYGTFIQIPVGQSKTISFSWQSSVSNSKLSRSFDYYFQKQSGVDFNDYSLSISFPSGLSASSSIIPQVASKGVLRYNFNTDRDIDLRLQFK